jgi:hypothetical protein
MDPNAVSGMVGGKTGADMERRFSMKFLDMKRLAVYACALGLFCGIAGPIGAQEMPTELRLQALAVPYASPWQRATPEQEAEDDALLLDAPQAGMQLAVLRQSRVLKTDAETYFARLTDNWRQLYGTTAQINRIAFNDQSWLACQRPARAGGGSVWQLSTVYAERTYNVLLFAPAGEAQTPLQIPTPARELLAAMRFGDPAPVAARLNWIKTRTLFPRTNVEVLEALVQDDIARLGEDGLITGYGLNFDATGAGWFIEGYQWKVLAERVDRVALKSGGRLDFELPPAADSTAKALLRLSLQDDDAEVGVQLRVWPLCAPEERIAETLAQLQRGARAPMQRLAQESIAGCPPPAGLVEPLAALKGSSGKTVLAEVAVVLPPVPDVEQQSALQQAGLSRIVLVEVALNVGPRRTGLGDRLIERARGYVVYRPEPAAVPPGVPPDKP